MLRNLNRVAFLLGLTGIAAPAVAQHMNADNFYRRAVALRSKGPLALFSGKEIRALTAEGHAAGALAGARFDADRKAGRATRYCPPPGPRTMSSNEYLERLGRLPAAERARIDLTEATIRLLAVKFPCRR